MHPRAARNLAVKPPQMALPSQLSLYDQALKDRVFLAFSFPIFPPCFFPIREGNGSLDGRIDPCPCVLFLSLTSVQNRVNGPMLMHRKYKKYSVLNTGKLCSLTREQQISLFFFFCLCTLEKIPSFCLAFCMNLLK